MRATPQIRAMLQRVRSRRPATEVFSWADSLTDRRQRKSQSAHDVVAVLRPVLFFRTTVEKGKNARTEEHTSELPSQAKIVCRLLLGKKKTYNDVGHHGTCLY